MQPATSTKGLALRVPSESNYITKVLRKHMSHTVEQQTPFPIVPTLWEPSPRRKKAINTLKKGGWLRRIALKEWEGISPDEIGQAKHTNFFCQNTPIACGKKTETAAKSPIRFRPMAAEDPHHKRASQSCCPSSFGRHYMEIGMIIGTVQGSKL